MVKGLFGRALVTSRASYVKSRLDGRGNCSPKTAKI